MNQLQDSFKKRVKDFRKSFSTLGIEAFIAENPKDIFYFTGVNVSRGTFFIGPMGATLAVDGRYLQMAQSASPFPVSGVKGEDLLKLCTSKSWKELKTVGFDTGCSFADYKKWKNFFIKLKKKLKPCDGPIQKQRAVKNSAEIALLKKSAALLWKGFNHLWSHIKVGVTEIELAHAFEFYAKKNGAEALAFDPIVAFGANSALPHHHTGSKKLKKGDVILVDIGVALDGYMSDMTRVLFFGAVSKELEEMNRLVRKAHGAVLQACRAGVLVSELDQIARNAMGEKEKLFLHSLGHGIGLDVHEYPIISTKTREAKLEVGMVVTIEPGLYLPGVGGIRHEDMIVITKTGYQNLFEFETP